MSLANYGALKAAVAGWLRRTDLTEQIPDFIALAEAQMNRRVRARRKILRASSTIDAEFMGLPDDFAGVRTFRAGTGTLACITPEQMAQLKDGAAAAAGEPTRYAIVGGEFEFDRVPAAPLDCEIAYAQAIPALSDTAPTNWVLQACPDAYLYGALLQAAAYLKADERIETWAQLFATAIDDLNAQSLAESHGGAMAGSPTTAVV